MNFNSTKRKIEKTFKRVQDSFNNLGIKLNFSINNAVPTSNVKGPQVLYDSGWIESLPVIDNIVPEHDPDVFVLARRSPLFGTTEEDALHSFVVDYVFKLNVDIPEAFLPFLKTTIMVKPAPTVEVISQTFNYQTWDRDPSYEIKGDSTLIFQGFDIPTSDTHKLSLEDLNNGASTPSLTSKWYSGEINYTESGDSVVITNADVTRASSIFNYSVNGGGENFDSFNAFAISSLTQFNFRGTGTFIEQRWTFNVGTEEWELTVTVTKNVTKTVTLSGHISKIWVDGTKTVNGGAPSIRLHEVILTDVSVTLWDFTYQDFHRIFYSNKLAKVFFTKTFSNGAWRELDNKPVKDDYQTNTNPYSSITYKINKDPLPDSIESSDVSVTTNESKSWLKIKENQEISTYSLSQIGWFYCKSPATVLLPQPLEAEDEVYNNIGGSYVLSGENRDDKEKDAYFPALLPVEVKLLITVNAKLLNNQTEHFKLEPIELPEFKL